MNRRRREHAKWNAIFGAIMALALVGGGFLVSQLVGALAYLMGAG